MSRRSASFTLFLIATTLLLPTLAGCASDQVAGRQPRAEKARRVAERHHQQQIVKLLNRLAGRLPRANAAPSLESMSMMIAAKPALVTDGYTWSLWRDSKDRFWLARHGGFTGGWRWRGPADPRDQRVHRLMELRSP